MTRRLLLLCLGSVLYPVALCACNGLADVGFDGDGGPFPEFSETTTSKQLTVTLDDVNPVQRFVIPIVVNPGSFDARLGLLVTRAERPFLLEFIAEDFSSNISADWADADVNFSFNTFSSGATQERIRLSLGRQDNQNVSIDMDLVLVAPTDVDFDGFEDEVVVEIGTLEPVIVE